MLAKDIKALYEAYAQVYDEATDDLITDDLIEEVVEELINECLEFGYTLEEALDGVERAAELYFDAEELEEAKVTYGSDTESPAERTARAKARLGGMKATARKSAVKSAVSKIKSKAAGAKASAGIGASIAKDEARRAGRAVGHAVQKKKAQIKSGVKSMIGKGLRKAAGAVGKVAQKAAGAASRLGEEVENVDEEKRSFPFKKVEKKMDAVRKETGYSKPGNPAVPQVSPSEMSARNRLHKLSSAHAKAKRARQEADKASRSSTFYRDTHPTSAPKMKKSNEEFEIDNWDLVLEFLVSEGYADTNEDAIAVMAELDREIIQSIVEGSAELSAAARKRAEELGRKRRSTKAYKQGLNRGTGRNERAAYNLSNIQRTHAANPSTQVSRSRKPAGYDTGAHKGDYGRFNRSKPEKNPKHDANK